MDSGAAIQAIWKMDSAKWIPGDIIGVAAVRNGFEGLSVLLLVICNSVKMGIRLCYKWDEPE
jgi:hypothetical protein